MDLFNPDTTTNLLPYDGVVNYYGIVLKQNAAQDYFKKILHNANWKNDEVVLFGKHIITNRKVAWYGDTSFEYAYSNTTKKATTWSAELLELKGLVEQISGETFNSCLLNLYHNGREGMGWHSDDEKSLGEHSVIASLSFGAERKFSFKHKKTKLSVSKVLESGSLLIMKGETQKNWLHSLPKTTKVSSPRINLTFRKIIV